VNTGVEIPERLARAEPALERARPWALARTVVGLGRFARRNPLGALGALIVVALLVMAMFAERIAPYSYDDTIRGARMKPPSAAHWLGTDNLSRDLWSRIVYGARVSITVGFATIGLAVLLALSSTLAPLAGEAQQSGKVWRIGVLGNENSAPWEGFRQGLRDLGYIDGRNVTMEWRWSEGRTDRLPALALELVQLKVDIIVASGTQAVQAAKQATGTIPIVMTVSGYPDKIGLVESLARPGGNVTGLSNVAPELAGKRLQLLREIAPGVSRVAVLWNPASPVEPLWFRELLVAAPAAGVEIQSVEVRSPDDFPAAFAAVASNRAHGLMAFGNPVNFKGRQLIADFAARNRLPSVYEERLFVEAGGLMSYAPSFTDLFRRAATYVDKILKGAKPADLPVEQPTKFELVINLKTAKALGLTIPQSVLLRTDEVIE